jgi:hypothetical protein
VSFPSNRPPALDTDPLCRIAVLERNRTVAQRAGRVLRAASGLGSVAVEADPATLRSMLSDDLQLLACDASDLDLALEWAQSRYRDLSVVAWSSGSMAPLLEAARSSANLVSLIGWPSFASMPRPWELALATRRIVDASAGSPRLSELFSWGSTVMKYRPRTSRDRDAIVAEMAAVSERSGASQRVAQRVGEVAHEMLMNAMYDAPAGPDGVPRYAHDRKGDIELEEGELPMFRFAADGVHVALQIVDPFGRLTRAHVLDGILRGLAGAEGSGEVLDTSGGGAGLGLYRIYSQSTVMVVDVAPGRYTSVTTFFDLDVNPRDVRTMPVSLHLFDPTAREKP